MKQRTQGNFKGNEKKSLFFLSSKADVKNLWLVMLVVTKALLVTKGTNVSVTIFFLFFLR